MRLPSHPFMYFTNSNARHVYEKRKSSLLQDVLMELEYQLDVKRVTNRAHGEHL
jgi:hypothetical protein